MQALLGIFSLVEPSQATSYQSACKTAHAWAGKRFGWDPKRVPDPAGFKRARDRVDENTCARLLAESRQLARRRLRQRTKRFIDGRPLVAFDGTTLHMPRAPEMVSTFGVPKDKLGGEICHYPQARMMTAWDLESRIPISWELGSLATGERAMASDMLKKIPDHAICVFDRGFPSRDFFAEMLDSGRHLVARMVCPEATAWAEVATFLASGKRDAIVPVWVGSGTQRRQVLFRLVLRTFDRGRPCKHQKRQTMVLITSLIDAPLTARDLCRLYGERWGIETIYRELKAVAKVECWHGRTIALVRQEIILLLVWFCLAAILAGAAAAARAWPAAGQSSWRANTRRVFEAIARIVEALLAGGGGKEMATELTQRAEAAMLSAFRWMSRKRPGRSRPRKPLHPYARTL
jgi:hypothetical protein